MNPALKSFSLTCLLASLLAIHGTTAYASIDPATLKPLPSAIKAGTKPIFSIMTDKTDRVKAILVSYRGPGVWFSETLRLAPKPGKKKQVLWEAATPERFDYPGELVYSLRATTEDGSEIVTSEMSSAIEPADIPPVIADPYPAPIFPVAGSPFKIVTNIRDDGGVKRVSLFFRMGKDQKFREVPMRRASRKKNDVTWAYTFKKIRNAGNMTCYVKAWDTARNVGRSNDLHLAVRTAVSLPAVEGLTVQTGADETVRLTWSPVQGKGIAGYQVFRDGRFLAVTSSTGFTDKDLPPGTILSYQVAARNNEDAVGPRTEAVQVQIPVADNSPPRVWLSGLWETAPVFPGITIDGGTEDWDRGDAVRTIRLTLDNGFSQTIQGEDLKNWTFTIPWDWQTTGRHILVMEAVDRHGALRRSEAALTFVSSDPKPLRDTKITVDAGHGLFWTGEKWSYQRPYCSIDGDRVVYNREPVQDGHPEDEITSLIAEKLVRRLQDLGATVYTTRELNRDKGPGRSGSPQWMEGALCYLTSNPETAPKWRSDDVHVRWQYAEHMGSDIMVSIHANLGRMSGTETIYSYEDNKDGKERNLALAIQKAVISELRKRDPLWVDRRAKTDLEASAHFDAVVKRPLLPSVIVEAGFNDNLKDHRQLMNPEFQESFAKGVAAGIVQYFENQKSLSASSRDSRKPTTP